MLQSVRPTQALGCLLLSLLGACSGLGIKADAGYAQFTLAGDVGLAPSSPPGLSPIEADVEKDLGLRDDMGSPYGRVEAALGIASLTVSGFAIDQSGTGQLNVQFGDIPATATVVSDIEVANLKAAVHFDLLNIGVVRISPGLGADIFDLDLKARATSPIIVEESVEAVAPVPMLFLQAEADIGIFEGVVDIGGFYADVGDANGAFLDIEVLARIKPLDHVEIFAGFRHIMLDVEGVAEGQDYLGDLTLTGWMIGGGIYF